MKYIRTKDGIHIKNSFKDSLLEASENAIKQADTIEELCDAYVITSKQGHIYDTYGDYSYELKQVLPQARKEEPDEDWDLYGCVLVNGIIKQVAKTNEKGELELL
jgi:hypothetical protein